MPSLLKLRDAVGPTVGANLDPSHLFWMGADPLLAAEALGDAIYHVHAKDTFLNAPKQATTRLRRPQTGSPAWMKDGTRVRVTMKLFTKPIAMPTMTGIW